MLIRLRNPKLQSERRLSLLSQRDSATALGLYSGVRLSIDKGVKKPMNTIVELSPDQAQISLEDLGLVEERPTQSLSPLIQGSNRSALSITCSFS